MRREEVPVWRVQGEVNVIGDAVERNLRREEHEAPGQPSPPECDGEGLTGSGASQPADDNTTLAAATMAVSPATLGSWMCSSRWMTSARSAKGDPRGPAHTPVVRPVGISTTPR